MNGILAYILSKKAAKSYTDEKIAQLPIPFKVKEPVQTFADLPLTGNEPGDVRKVIQEDNKEYYWSRSAWEALGPDNPKENLFRFTTMPEAAADNLGQIVQYIGTSTADYVKGYFYQCVVEDDVYSWEQTNAQPGYDDTALASRVSAIESQEDTWNGKQDAISDLDDIRSGAAAGGTALQPSALTPYRTAAAQDVIDEGLQDGIDAIEELIPSQATSSNKLADKEFVNSSIATNTATFRGTYTSTDDFPTSGVDDNDYVFLQVMSTVEPTEVERYDRYKWNGTQFVFEYSLNNSSFTAAQWAAINSGITSGDAALIRTALQPEDLDPYRTSSEQDEIDEALEERISDIEGKEDSWDGKQEPVENLDEETPCDVNFKDTVMKKEAVEDDVATFTEDGDIKDSGKKLSEYIEYADHDAMRKLMEDVVLDENEKAALISTDSVPASASDPGFKGQIAFDSNYMYVCVANNSWKKIALQSL